MRLALASALLLLAAGPQDPPGFVNREYGFRIARPDASWVVEELSNVRQAQYGVRLYRKGDAAQAAVTVYVSKAEAPDADRHCDRVEKKFGKLGNLTRGKSTVAGLETPWLTFDYPSGAKTYRLQQHYFIRNGHVFTVQSAALADGFARHERVFRAIVGSFAFVEATGASLKKLAARCGSEIDWAADWAEASRRAAREKKLIVVVAEIYRGFKIDPTAPAAVFMDPDVVELMRERFVALRWNETSRAPIQDPRRYGMGPMTFGRGILFATPDARVAGECPALNPYFFYARAVEILDENPEFTGTSVPKNAADHLRRGELEEAWELLKRPSSAAEHRLQADLLRKLRLGEEALRALKRAGAPDLERAKILVQLGRLKEAEAILRKEPPGPEARFWLGVVRFGLKMEAARVWEEVTKKWPDSRWAWMAAAILGLLPEVSGGGTPRVGWPEERVMKALRESPSERAARDRAEKDGVATLLGRQLENGSFITPLSLSGRSGGFGAAVTAICAASLMGAGKTDDAVDRALRFILEEQKAGVLSLKGKLFDMAIWGQIFSVRFLSRCVSAGVGDRRELVGAMNAIIKDMAAEQDRSGGWAYALRGGNSIGFVTAAAALALMDARKAGAKVPEKMLDKALNVLEQLRHPSGSFGYMLSSGRGSADRQAEASLRSPLYAFALHRGGKGGVDAIRRAFDIYLKHRRHVRKERGKTLCHTGPEGTASYYLLYGYAFMAEALAALPVRDRARYREAILDDVLAARRQDGSFLDNPTMGRAYGTGMALLTFRHLAK